MFSTVRPRRGAAVVALILGLAGIVAACGDDTDVAEPTDATEAAVPEQVDWSYEGEEGPEHWGELSEEFTTCVDGSAQSPIDLAGATEEDIADIGFAYSESPLSIFNNGHTIEIEYEEGSSITLEGTTYNVVQFHFHAGSEHLVDGEQYPLEMHIVHSTGDGALAVVGLLTEVGAENEALAPVFDNIPTEVTDEAEPVDGAAVDLADVLPDAQTYFRYDGSLTTPPCTEGVSWQVLDTPIEVSRAQLDAFTAVVDGNSRPAQPLGDRELIHDSASGA